MRFAYLIMAHDNQTQLESLLKSLDYEGNEIFLHIDKKSTAIDIDMLSDIIKNAIIHIYKKYNVYWGDISQTKCQLFLLKEAIKNSHDYYHLLSGKDLLIKNHQLIVDFFNKNKGKEFVHFEKNDFSQKETNRYYHLFFYLIQRTKNNRLKMFLKLLQRNSLLIQKKLNIQRKVYTGANWFSITHKLAVDFVNNRRKALRKVCFMQSSDECILQTFLKEISKNKYEVFCPEENDYNSIMRFIDWNRGSPYVFKTEDYEELINSNKLFARKFDENVDFNIIKMISNYIAYQ